MRRGLPLPRHPAGRKPIGGIQSACRHQRG